MEKNSGIKKRLMIFAGHYGSGKTSLAVSYALHLRTLGLPVTIGDLDIVNPYFRTSDRRKELEEKGVELICSPYAGSNLDIPALPKELYGAIENNDRYRVLDVGGDDVGAVALGRYVPFIREENDYEMAFVVNFYRPLTRTAEEALAVMREITAACGLPFTGIVNNSNIGGETAPADVIHTLEPAAKLAELSGLPLLATTVSREIFPAVAEKTKPVFMISTQPGTAV